MPSGVYVRTEKHRLNRLGKYHSIETRQKQSLKKLGNKNASGNKGRITPMEIRQKISLKLMNHIVTQETRDKISKSKLGKPGHKQTEETRNKISLSTSREKGNNWQDGKSFEPYGPEFNKQLKEDTRKHDNYRCQECFRHQSELFTKSGKPYKLIVHHIDYNKRNNSPENLICLCRSCHAQTNFKRSDWTQYFNQKRTQCT